MLHAPISQIMNTDWHQWETTRFSVFKRASRVEVNTRKDLEDMLTKLDETSTNTVKKKTESRTLTANRRKLMELVLPCGILALLSLIYSLIYLVEHGEGIVSSSQVRDYLNNFEAFDKCVSSILDEHSQRLIVATGSTDTRAGDYYRTDAALDDILNSKTLAQWKIISQIHDWRNKKEEDFIRESEFYLQFILDLKRTVIFSQGFRLKKVYKWKSHFEYLTSLDTAAEVNILLNILSKYHTSGFKHIMQSNSEEIVSFVAKFSGVMCAVNMRNGTRGLTCSYELFRNLQLDTYPQNETTNATSHANDLENVRTGLKEFRMQLEKKLIYLRKDLKQTNTEALRTSAVLFCMLFVFIGATAAGISLFVRVFQEEARVAVVVSDMLEGVTSKVKQQRESTDQVVNKLIPKNLVRKVNVDHQRNMIPYEACDTTLFLVSIAGYTKFFSMFTASQTIHILTLVMELLDERMEQYNVFPVARMCQYLLVLSDSEVQKQVRNACEIANLAIDIMTCCSDLEIGRYSTSKLQMKLALHTGPCQGRLVIHNGTVQLKIVGNTLTVLRQIHKAAIPNMIQVSETTQRLLAACDCYSLHYRGNLKIPNMSKYYKVYWLNGRRVSSALSLEDTCSRMGSWIELEKKPLYRLDENEGTYEPLNKSTCRRYSQISGCSYKNQTGQSNNDSYLGMSDASL